jgi:hypothetical protein
MRRALHVIALGAALGGTLLLPSAARACSCLPKPPPAEALERAAVVFEGRTFAHERFDTGPGPGRIRFSFEVIRHFKGDPGPKVTVETAGHSAACGRSFRQGVPYLVYARERNGQLIDNLCSRTRLSSEASEDFEVLGEGESHGHRSSPGEADQPPREPPRIERPPASQPPAGSVPGKAKAKAKEGCNVTVHDVPASSLMPLALLLAIRRRRS